MGEEESESERGVKRGSRRDLVPAHVTTSAGLAGGLWAWPDPTACAGRGPAGSEWLQRDPERPQKDPDPTSIGLVHDTDLCHHPQQRLSTPVCVCHAPRPLQAPLPTTPQLGPATPRTRRRRSITKCRHPPWATASARGRPRAHHTLLRKHPHPLSHAAVLKSMPPPFSRCCCWPR